jgi:3-methyladenine DNA glycosylase AlkC
VAGKDTFQVPPFATLIMSLIKDIYSPEFFERFAHTLQGTLPSFNKQKFLGLIFDESFKNKEWKDRMKHTTRVLHEFLPAGFSNAVSYIRKIIRQLIDEKTGEDNLAYIFFADYIETYGLDHLEESVKALEFITQFISCEFAVRPFILKYGDKMLEYMTAWSLHESSKVRRLSSEGSRPRLPWAMALPALKRNPAPLLPILENLKNDPSESVRRSVANNLNDIAKDHPDFVIIIARRWTGISKETDAIIRHGCRTLLKKGHADVLTHFNLTGKQIELADFKLPKARVKIGDSLEFSFSIFNNNVGQQVVRLEYGIYYNKSNGQLARKVFKISERVYQPYEKAIIKRKQSFRLITTRKFYAGEHRISIIINGQEKEVRAFTLVN